MLAELQKGRVRLEGLQEIGKCLLLLLSDMKLYDIYPLVLIHAVPWCNIRKPTGECADVALLTDVEGYVTGQA